MIKLITIACLGWTRATEVGSGNDYVVDFVEQLKEKCLEEECFHKRVSYNCPAECANVDRAITEFEIVRSVKDDLEIIPVDYPDLSDEYQQKWELMEAGLLDLTSKHRTWKSLPGVREYVLMKRYLGEILDKVKATPQGRGVIESFENAAIQLFHELADTTKLFRASESYGYKTLTDSHESFNTMLSEARVASNINGIYETMLAMAAANEVPNSVILPFVVSQMAEDRKRYVYGPRLIKVSERLPGFGIITLESEKPIARKAHVAVFKLTGRAANWVIKYQTNCGEIGAPVTDILRDAWFLELASQHGVSPKMIFLSPPTVIRDLASARRVGFDTSKDAKWSECLKHPYGSEVRFMVMERIDYTVLDMVYSHDIVPETLKLPKPQRGKAVATLNRIEAGLNMAIGVIEKLRTLHTLEEPIVHGDVHFGNIGVKIRGNVPEPHDFFLIDFGKAFFENELADLVVTVRWPPHCLLSHFNLQGSRLGFRDDVYKTLLAAAFLMVGPRLVTFCEQHAGSGDIEDILWFHERFVPFDHIAIIEPLPGSISLESQLNQIKEHLRSALELARGVRNVEDLPNHMGIIMELKKAKALVQSSQGPMPLIYL